MARVILVLFLLCTVFGAPVAAQDGLGVFFDEQGLTTEATTATPYGMVTAYIQLLDPAATDEIRGCEFRFELHTEGPDPILVWTLPDQALNVLEAPSFMIGYGAPLAPQPRVTLAQVQIILPEAGQTVWLSVHPIAEPSLLDPPGYGYPVHMPAYSHGEDSVFTAMVPTTDCTSQPLAVINRAGQAPEPDLGELPASIVMGDWYNGGALQPLVLTNAGPVSYTGWVDAVEPGAVRFRIDDNYLTDGPVQFQVPVGGYTSIVIEPVLDTCEESAIQLDVCGAVQVIPIASALEWTPPFIQFAQLPVDASAHQTVSVRNVSDQRFYTLDVPFASGPFELVPLSGCHIVDPGESCQMYVYYRPTSAGEHEAVLSPSGGFCGVAVAGSAVDMPPVCRVMPESVDFGGVMLGSHPGLRAVDISNQGGGILEGAVTLADPDGPFRLRDQNNVPRLSIPYALSFQQTQFFYVEFEPQAEQEFFNQVLLSGGCDPLPIQGEGLYIEPHCLIEGPYGQYADGVMNIPPVPVSGRSYSFVMVSNQGGGQLSVVPTLEDTTGLFQLYYGEPRALAYLEQTVCYVTYEPQNVGRDTTYLDLGTGCGDPILVTGEGQEPYESCYTYGYRQDVGRLPVGETTVGYFLIRNDGYLDLQGNLDLTGDGFHLVNPGPFDLAVGESVYEVLLFAPQDEGEFEAVVNTGLEPCPGDLVYTGLGVPPGSDKLGFYVDEAGDQNHWDPVNNMETTTAYLVLHNPSASGPLMYWYANYSPSGDLLVMDDWQSPVPGHLWGYSYYMRFRTDYPIPLAEDMMLASFTVQAVDADDPAMLSIGYGYYQFQDGLNTEYVPLYNPDNLLVNASKSYFEDLPAAPVLEPGDGGITLRWPARLMDVEGFHVYRRLGDGLPEKLTEEPVMAEDGEAFFLDGSIPEGDVEAVYHVRALHMGEEGLPGKETVLKIAVMEVGPPPVMATRLLPNYPNPFNPQTHLPFELEKPGLVTLRIYDLAGRLVRTLVDEEYPAGGHEVLWNGRDDAGRQLPSNVYYAKLETAGIMQMQKMTLLK
jgi:hypothetical protein